MQKNRKRLNMVSSKNLFLEYKRNLTKIIRDIWGYCIVFNGMVEEELQFKEMFDPE